MCYLRLYAECMFQVLHPFTQRGSQMQSDFHQFFKKNMEDRLATRPDIAEKCTSILSIPLPLDPNWG